MKAASFGMGALLWVGALGLVTHGCSSGKGASTGTGGAGGMASGGVAAGGRGGAGGIQGSGGNGPGGGATGGAIVASSEPLCPKSTPIPSGVALPDGVEVASTATDARLLVATDTYVYWSNQKVIKRISVQTGAETMVLDRSTANDQIQELAVDGDYLYFSEAGIFNALGVARIPLDGSAAPATVLAGNSFFHIAVTNGYVYGHDLGANDIVRGPAAGVAAGGAGGASGVSAPTVLVRDVNPTAMTVVNGYIYFMHPQTNATDNVNLLRVPVTARAPSGDGGVGADAGINIPAGAERVVPVSNYSATGVKSDGTYLYYDDANKVMRVPLAGGSPTLVAKAPDGEGILGTKTTRYVGMVVPSGGWVYWTIDNNGGCLPLIKSSGDGVEQTTYVRNIWSPSVLDVNASHVYFIIGGQILRVSRTAMLSNPQGGAGGAGGAGGSGQANNGACQETAAAQGQCNANSLGVECMGSAQPDPARYECFAQFSGTSGPTYNCCRVKPSATSCQSDVAVTCDRGFMGYSCSGTGNDTPAASSAVICHPTGTSGGQRHFCCGTFLSNDCDLNQRSTGCGGSKYIFDCKGMTPERPDQKDRWLACGMLISDFGDTTACCTVRQPPTLTCSTDPALNCAPSVGYVCTGSDAPPDGDPTLVCGDPSVSGSSSYYCCRH